jgi:hypothetical protein
MSARSPSDGSANTAEHLSEREGSGRRPGVGFGAAPAAGRSAEESANRRPEPGAWFCIPDAPITPGRGRDRERGRHRRRLHRLQPPEPPEGRRRVHASHARAPEGKTALACGLVLADTANWVAGEIPSLGLQQGGWSSRRPERARRSSRPAGHARRRRSGRHAMNAAQPGRASCSASRQPHGRVRACPSKRDPCRAPAI